ncbi:hypothetical protein WDU94_005052 [Cyamophila willieti]
MYKWIEESFTNFEKGINWRSYVVCDVAYHNVNNWLWTPFIERGNANRIYIEIKFTIRDCALFPGNALSCKETFSLLYYEFDAATREPPPWEPESYKLIGRIAAGEGRFNTNTEVNINTEVKSIPVTKKGVYFAFRDQGACISLLAIKVYYITCPETTINFAHFPATPTAREVTVIEPAKGRCVENAEEIEEPKYLCKGDGKWYLPSGGCKCKPGFEADVEKQTCNVCPPGKFKHATGDDHCQPCPLNSKAPDYGFAECRCTAGFYRAAKDPKTMPCTREFAERLENYIERTNIFHNLTHDLTTYHLMCGFLTQLDKEFIIESKPQDYSADHILIPRLHTKHDDTVIVFQYSGAQEYSDLEDMVSKGMVHMLRQNYKRAILQHFPSGNKESKRIRQVLLISLGISGNHVLVKHEKYKMESGGDKFSKVLQTHLSNHDMGALQKYLEQIIIATKTHIENAADLKDFVEGFLDKHEDFYSKSNDAESIYIPMTRRKNGKNIAYLIRYKVLSSRDQDRTDELEDKCHLEDTAFFEQFPTVDTVRTVLLFHKKS